MSILFLARFLIALLFMAFVLTVVFERLLNRESQHLISAGFENHMG